RRGRGLRRGGRWRIPLGVTRLDDEKGATNSLIFLRVLVILISSSGAAAPSSQQRAAKRP
ncbi:hypothetical protein MHJ89_11555, partial [Corynebacterium hadale]|uniref:hypothetical protein n=1 Tax=Corynebacterium hadale TaxID=2026255 RepID=UPI001EF2E62D